MKKLEQSTISLLVGLAALLLVIIVLVVIGWLTSSTQKLTIQGTVEAQEYRVSGKVAGRVEQLLFREGDTVSKGQIVVKLDSPELQAKIVQANAQSRAARAQRAKASGSARSELVEGAFEQWQKAKATEKVYGAIKSLGFKDVIEVAQGAMETTSTEAAELQEKIAEGQPFMTTSCCPSWIELVRKHIPDIL